MKKTVRNLFTGVLALSMCVGIAACGGSNSAKASANGYLSFDINPSLELIVRDGKVSGVKAGNNDANVLIANENFVGLTVEEASKKIAKLAEDMGYLNENNKKVKINVLTDTAEDKKNIESEAKEGITEGSSIADINMSTRAHDERVCKKLNIEGLTPEKVRLIESIMPYDATMTYEIGAKMKVSKLMDILEDCEEDYEDMVSDELEDKFDARYDEEKKVLDRKIAEIYDKVVPGYLVEWENYQALEVELEMLEDRAENASIKDEDIQSILGLLGIQDKTLIQDENGNINEDSIEDYFDKHFDDDGLSEEEENALDEKEDAIEAILEKYDEDNYVLTAEEYAKISELAKKAGLTEAIPENVTLDELEDIIEPLEDKLEEKEEEIESKLTDEQKKAISDIEKEKDSLKQKIREEMKGEIQKEKERISQLKEDKLAKNK